MQQTEDTNVALLAHHEQQPLCTTRLPYRQGRRLTAVKVYTIANESNHLLVFGVPALNLRQETKALFMKFGKLLKFNISAQHPSEPFTDTYHAHYERIQSARIAKRMLDTKNFYGGLLHVCYAPELETIQETREKLLQRQKDVTYRLHNLRKADAKPKKTVILNAVETKEKEKEVKVLNMSEVNVISFGKERVKSKRRKGPADSTVKKFKPCFVDERNVDGADINKVNNANDFGRDPTIVIERGPEYNTPAGYDAPIEVVDCTSVDNEVITNINEHLNYDKFGNEDVRCVPKKTVNRIVFNVNKRSNI